MLAPFKVYVKHNEDDLEKVLKCAMLLFRSHVKIEENEMIWIELTLSNWYYAMMERCQKHVILKEGEWDEYHINLNFGGYDVKGTMVVMA